MQSPSFISAQVFLSSVMQFWNTACQEWILEPLSQMCVGWASPTVRCLNCIEKRVLLQKVKEIKMRFQQYQHYVQIAMRSISLS